MSSPCEASVFTFRLIHRRPKYAFFASLQCWNRPHGHNRGDRHDPGDHQHFRYVQDAVIRLRHPRCTSQCWASGHLSRVASRLGLRHRHLQVHRDGSRAALRHGADRGPVQVHLPGRGRVHHGHQGQTLGLHGEQHRAAFTWANVKKDECKFRLSAQRAFTPLRAASQIAK